MADKSILITSEKDVGWSCCHGIEAIIAE